MIEANGSIRCARVACFDDGETGGRAGIGFGRCPHTFLVTPFLVCISLIFTSLLFTSALAHADPAPGVFDVRAFGAKGDGATLDTDALNKAIEAAAAAGGGTVYLPAGRYLSFSIRLKSHITLQLAPGAVIVAADTKRHKGRYDPPEKTVDDLHQDFGHSHWHNSLIWGEGFGRTT